MKRLAVALLVAAAAVLLPAAPAAAHAVLVGATPGDRARLDAAPAEVVLEFSEAVGAGLGSVRVFDAEGERVDTGAVAANGARVTVPLEDGLGDGAFIVTYRVVSADSHPVRGALTFTVGDAEEAADDLVSGLLGEDEDRAWEIVGGAFRGLAYVAALLATGLAAFLVLAHDGGPEGRGLRRVLRVAATAGALGVLAALPVQAALATGLGADALFESGVLGDVLENGLGLSTALLLAGLAAVALDAGRRRWVSLAGALLATTGFAFAGHTTATDPRWLVTAAAAVHVSAAGLWFGGLAGVVAVVRARRGTTDAAPVIARFSAVAAIAIAAVVVAGSTLAWSEVRALDALTSTTYGDVLVAKLLVAVAIGAVAGWNRFRLVPLVAKAPAAVARLSRLVRVEAALLVVVLGLTAALVQVTPARVAAGVGSIFSTTVPLGDGEVNLVVDPNQAGTNSIHLYLFDAGGRPLDPEGLTLELSLPSSGVGPIEREPFVAGPGHRQLDGGDLSIPGRWTIEVVARVDRFTESTATIEVPVRP